MKIRSNAYSIVHNRAVIPRGMPERSANALRNCAWNSTPGEMSWSSCRMKLAKDPLGKDAGGETGATGGLAAPLECPVPNAALPPCYCLHPLRNKTPGAGTWKAQSARSLLHKCEDLSSDLPKKNWEL